jgi:hypothetical protein
MSTRWEPFDGGATVGQRGSEDGVIFRDEEHKLGARITLERDCAHGVPFAVSCGIYGWFFHTRFVGSEAEAEFPAMMEGLEAILDTIPRVEDPAADAKAPRKNKLANCVLTQLSILVMTAVCRT